jgi:hypothetical protein
MPTVAELKDELDAKNIDYQADAKKAELEELLKTEEKPAEEPEEPQKKPAKLMTVNVPLLNVRITPDDEFKPETVAGVLKEGEEVLVEQIVDEWAYITGGTFCRAEFLR